MIVLDASVVVELLINGPLSAPLSRKITENDGLFIAPQILDIEVLSAVRRLSAVHRLDAHRTRQILESLHALPAERCSHLPLLERIWELRHNFTAYDATYIALAEMTGSILYTLDAKLTKGHRAPVHLFN